MSQNVTPAVLWEIKIKGEQWRQRLGNFGGWIDAKVNVSWGTEVTQWGPGAKNQ